MITQNPLEPGNCFRLAGLLRLLMVADTDVVALPAMNADGLASGDVVLVEGATVHEVPDYEAASLSENRRYSSAGEYFEVDAMADLVGNEGAVLAFAHRHRNRRFVVFAQTPKGYWLMCGTKKTPLRLDTEFTTGKSGADARKRMLTLRGQTLKPLAVLDELNFVEQAPAPLNVLLTEDNEPILLENNETIILE
jgi:hypothetical protein